MPWCDECDRFLNPNTVHDDGTCPGCGSTIARSRHLQRSRRGRGASADAMAVRAAGVDTPADPADAVEDVGSTPWHFKLLLVALVVYLGWRFAEAIVWLADKL